MTLYVDIPGGLQLWLKISEWLNERLEESQFGFLQGVPYGIWFNGDKEMAEQLVDFVSLESRDCVEVFDGKGALISSTYPTDHKSIFPSSSGKYLCFVEEGGIREWRVISFIDGEWHFPVGRVLRWLHLPHYQQNLTKV